MNLMKRLIIIFVILFTCVGCDQGTKSLATNYLPRNEMYTYFHDFIRIGYIENTGAFLGLGSTLSMEMRFWGLSIMVGVFLLGLFIYLLYRSQLNSLLITGYSLVLGGGLSNLYDRVINHGAVVDFLNLGVGEIRTGIFNVADMAIMLGLVFILFTSFKYTKITSSSADFKPSL